MKMPKSVIAGCGALVLAASALAHAAPPDQRDDDRGGPPGQHEQRGDDHRGPQDDRRGGPPRDFGPVRQIIRDNHGQFGRGAPPPPDMRLVRGRPMPHGYYGERLDNRALARLPYYEGYEWCRSGPDVVLIAVGTGIVYEILEGVLN
ncbi:anti-virulence regulator CigR family protein [Pseudomonas sp.]|uniref:anti-virulence regulator CigR family protein n=1 Tax=Pseudomonas sp. TaxID=306 RepID=UPI003FD70B64